MGTPTATATSFAHRTPDQLERGMVVVFPGHTQHETVRRTKLVAGRWIVRTTTNLHRLHPRTRVVLVAEAIPGIGYVTPPMRAEVIGRDVDGSRIVVLIDGNTATYVRADNA